MDKETLSNYGWIVICVLILAVMMALASPFGIFVSDAIKGTTQGLFDVNSTALNTVGISVTNTKTVYFENNWNWSNPKIYYWGSEMGSNPNWDGISLTDTVGKTEAGYTVYKIEVPSDIDGMLFNGTGGYGFEQSEDVKDIKDGYAYYMTYTNNKKIAQSYLYQVEEEDETTSYTVEQIEADEHLYAIGKTKPEYVVAKFNDDYSEVVITKNGNDSDGIVMGWGNGNMTNSPMTNHKSTLSKATYKYGVVNTGSGGTDKYPFNNCWNLTTIILSNSIKKIDESSFSNSGIKDISIPNTVVEIGANAFNGCKNLESIDLPDSLLTINYATFGQCSSLKQINIPTSVNTIHDEVFNSCSSLIEIKIPNGTKDITSMFDNCSKLSKIYLPKSIVWICESTFFDIEENSVIYCETQEVADLLTDNNYISSKTNVIVDASKF